MNKLVKLTVALVAFVLVLAACGKDSSKRTTAENFSSFLNENEAIISFGSIRLGEILNKTGYESESKLKAMLGGTISQIKNSIQLDQTIYFAVEGPLKDGNPTATYLFLDVKNADSLKANLTTNGFVIEEGKSFNYLQDGELNLAFDQKMAVAVIKTEVDDTEKELKAVYEQMKKSESTGRVADILKKTDDLVVGANLANLYGTSNTDLEELPAEKQKELRDMMNNSFVELGVRFETGQLVVETKNHFSDALRDRLFFASDSKASVASNLGKGTPFMGASLNLDAKKMQEFLADYAPNAMKDLSKEIGGEFEKAMVFADYDASKLVSGQLGILLFGDIASALEGMTPDANLFVGLAGQGKMLGNLLKEQMAKDFEVVNLSDKGLSASTSSDYVGNSVQLPESGKNFGKNSFNLFIDLSAIDMQAFELEGATKFAEMVKFIQVEYGAEGGKLVIKSREGKENILKETLQKALSIFEGVLI